MQLPSLDAQRASDLVQALAALAGARSMDDLQRSVTMWTRRLLAADGATLVLRDVDRSYYVEEDAIAPLFKGLRFPFDCCVSGRCIIGRQTVRIPDIYADPTVPHGTYRPTFVTAILMVPVGREEPAGAIGVYWRERHDPGDDEELLLHAFADAVATALRNVQLLNEVQHTNGLLRSVVEDQTEFIVRWTGGGVLTFVNGAYARFFGVDPEHLEGASFLPFVHPDDRDAVQAKIASLTREHPVAIDEHRALRPDGGVSWQEWCDRAIFDDGGLRCYQSVGRDVSDRKLLQARLALAEKTEAIGRMTAGLAHDLNNLLMPVIGHVELALSRGVDPELRDALERVHGASEQARELLSELLTFGRRGAAAAQPLDLAGAVTRQLRVLRGLIPARVRLDSEIAEDAGVVQAARSQIAQILLNLVVNAIDAMPEGGVLRVAVARCAEEPGATCLSVADSGHGIPAALHGRVFEPWFTTRPGAGTGLGLATVHDIVRTLGGRLDIDSREERGTTVRIVLPLDTRDEATQPAVPDAARAATILVVEDHEDTRQVLQAMLERAGHRVLAADGMAAALDALGAHADVDAVVTDVALEDGSGIALYRRIRERDATLPVIFISGHGAEVLGELGLSERAFFLRKPFRAVELAERLAEALRRRR